MLIILNNKLLYIIYNKIMIINKDKKNIIEKLIYSLKEIYDPEISINIYDLGLIYDIQIDKISNVKIIMTLTTPNCPVADYFINEIKKKIKKLNNIKCVYFILTFNPVWSSDHLREEIRFQLELN